MKNIYYINTLLKKLSPATSSATTIECVDLYKYILNKIKPKEILEIGFHTGYSSLLFLSLSDANITSCDICNPKWVSLDAAQKSVEILHKEFGKDRLRFFQQDSLNSEFKNIINNRYYDLCFIDGKHEEDAPHKDILTCLELGTKYILVDDYDFNQTNHIPQIIDNFCKGGLFEYVKILNYFVPHNPKIWGSMALIKVK